MIKALHDSSHSGSELPGNIFAETRGKNGVIVTEEVLANYRPRLIRASKGTLLCEQGKEAKYFFVIRKGKIKMSRFNNEGREFVQGYFSSGQSFGEPPLFARTIYPASAIAVEDSEVWSLGYTDFLDLLRDHFEVQLALIEALSKRLLYKSMMLGEVALEEAEHRLKSLIRHFKRARGLSKDDEFMVPFTRQQLAELTGLRVETVIRTLRSMQQRGLVEIIQGKVFWTPKK